MPSLQSTWCAELSDRGTACSQHRWGGNNKENRPFSWASPACNSGQLHLSVCFLFLSFLKTNKNQQQTKKQCLCMHSAYECTIVIHIFTCLKMQVFSWDRSKWFFLCRVWLSRKLLPNPGSEVPSELQEAGSLGKTPSRMALQMLQLSSSKSFNNMIISGKWQGTKDQCASFCPSLPSPLLSFLCRTQTLPGKGSWFPHSV